MTEDNARKHSRDEEHGIERAIDVTPEIMEETIARMEMAWAYANDPVNNEFDFPYPGEVRP